MNTMPLEAATRQLIDTNLKNLGWRFTGENQNVFLEQPKKEAERKKLGGKRPDYVLYSKDSDTPLIVIEAKKRGERIDAALEQGIFYAKHLEAPLVFATDGVFCKSFHTLGNTTPKLNGEDVDEFVREALALKFLATWEVNTISEKVRVDRKTLINIFDEANNMLRGDGLRAGIERFGEFANILFLKLISESEEIKRDNGEKSNFDISCSWNTIKGIAPTARIDYINNMVYNKLNILYGTDIFTPLTIRDNTILKEIMDKIDPLILTDVDSDVKGDAFEYFLKASTATKNDLGEYFTPRHIVKTMVRLVNPQIGEKIYDPFCGTGGFLIESFRHIERNMAKNNKKLREILTKETIYGNEITNTARITKMNMILAGDGHNNIYMKDSLANPVYIDKIIKDEEDKICRDGDKNIILSDNNYPTYDIVITNMPYSQTTKYGNLYDLSSTSGDSVCVQHCIKAVNCAAENGRIALVVPEGFLFRKDLAKAREYMLAKCQLQSVISLPQGVFLPYTGVKTNIIYATKVNKKLKASEKRKDYWYFDVKSDGYTLDSHRRKLDIPSDLIKFEEYRKLDSDENESEEMRQQMRDEMLQVGFDIIPLDEVCKKSFVLVGSRYKERKSISSNYDMVNLGEVAEYINGFPFKPTDWNENGTPIIRIQNLTNTSSIINRTLKNDVPEKYKIETGDLLISWSATIGFYIWNGNNAYLNQHIFKVIPNNRILKKYLYFLKDYVVGQMKEFVHGGTMTHIIKDDFCKIKIPLPPLDIQQQIADEIESYHQIVNNAKNIIDKYKPLINYKSEWSRVKLKEVCKFSGGTQPPKSTFKYRYENGYIRLLQIRDYKNDDYATYIPVTSKHKTCCEDDIMIGRYGPPVFQILRGKSGAYNVALIKCIADENRITRDWLYYFLNSTPIQNYIIDISIRARQAGVSPTDLGNLDIPLPPLEIQKQIVGQIEAEQALIEPSKQLIEIFTKKIQDRINDILNTVQ